MQEGRTDFKSDRQSAIKPGGLQCLESLALSNAEAIFGAARKRENEE
jgi:hypothetical protein